MKGIMKVGRSGEAQKFRYIKICQDCNEFFKPMGRSSAIQACLSCKQKRLEAKYDRQRERNRLKRESK